MIPEYIDIQDIFLMLFPLLRQVSITNTPGKYYVSNTTKIKNVTRMILIIRVKIGYQIKILSLVCCVTPELDIQLKLLPFT